MVLIRKPLNQLISGDTIGVRESSNPNIVMLCSVTEVIDGVVHAIPKQGNWEHHIYGKDGKCQAPDTSLEIFITPERRRIEQKLDFDRRSSKLSWD